VNIWKWEGSRTIKWLLFQFVGIEEEKKDWRGDGEKNTTGIDETASLFIDGRKSEDEKLFSIIRNKVISDGALYEACGVRFNFEEWWIHRPLGMEKIDKTGTILRKGREKKEEKRTKKLKIFHCNKCK
jgi:hypothetical protein